MSVCKGFSGNQCLLETLRESGLCDCECDEDL